ncbi:MAG: DUF1640 domain-containing protein [Actinobacteria bacterium]|nr:DUF1640 domain-containing protein [Actinomycetota bacterium]
MLSLTESSCPRGVGQFRCLRDRHVVDTHTIRWKHLTTLRKRDTMPNMTETPPSAPSGSDDFDAVATRGFVRYEISVLRSELKQEIADLRLELKQEIADLRSELKQEIADLRSELHHETAKIWQEIASLRVEMAAMEHRIVVRLSVVVTFVVVVAQLGSALLLGR